jgi:hypothetical protein
MKRRDFVKAGITTFATSVINPKVSGALTENRMDSEAISRNKVASENGLYRLEADPETGLIVRILDKKSGVELITEPRLAGNFSLLLPLPDLEANYILR